MPLCPRRLRKSFAVLLVLAAMGGPALAGDPAQPAGAPLAAVAVADQPEIIRADDVAAIAEMARGYGEAEQTTLENGDPVVVGDMNGIAYQLFFLECTDNRDCKVLDFYAIWDAPGVQLGTINEWNRTRPFNKAYLGEDGLPVIELNLSTAGGLTRGQLGDAFDRWAVALADFQRSVVERAF
jgi:hypothetical protein